MKISSISDGLILTVATGFGCGFSPVAPGTAGSLLGVALYYLLRSLPLYAYLGATITIILIGIPVATRAEKLFGKRDSKRIVIDEVGGQLLALTAIPNSFLAVLAGFLLFRFFDILKFGPTAWAETVSGGSGVMLDDVVAGSIALGIIQLALHIY